MHPLAFRLLPPFVRSFTAFLPRLTLLTAGVVLAALPLARGQTPVQVETIYAFTGGADEAYPESGLILGTDGNFYGTTRGKPLDGHGSVFKITPAGALTTLYVFPNDASGKRITPSQLVQGSDGNFYGVTQTGGASNKGSVFIITPAGAFTTLYDFTGGDDGYLPNGPLRSSGGNFYGTTSNGGANGSGTVFQITPSGGLTTLYTFNNGSDGAFPYAPLAVGTDGNFYGTTTGDYTNTFGSVFRLTPTGVLTTLYAFPALPDQGGVFPNALVQGSDGNFYGTTQGDGTNSGGSVFRITPAGVYTDLHEFGFANDGQTPDNAETLLEDADGNFYGTCLFGGSAASAGTIFQITPRGCSTSSTPSREPMMATAHTPV